MSKKLNFDNWFARDYSSIIKNIKASIFFYKPAESRSTFKAVLKLSTYLKLHQAIVQKCSAHTS